MTNVFGTPVLPVPSWSFSLIQNVSSYLVALATMIVKLAFGNIVESLRVSCVTAAAVFASKLGARF